MKSALLLLLLCGASVGGWAAGPDPAGVLAERSGLPASEVRALLADCDASQISMNFCAWRDQVVAEQALQRVVQEQGAASSRCEAALTTRITAWKKRRDANCLRSAQKQWGGGSMLPTAVAMCATDATKRMTRAVRTRPCH